MLNPVFEFSLIAVDEITAAIDKENSPEVVKLNPFPVDVFPKAIQQIIFSTNESLNFPIDFIGSSMLFAASLAIGNTYKVEVKRGWQENAVLFMVNVGKPNTNKSHPLGFALQPISDRDRITYREYEKKKIDYNQALNLPKKERENQNPDSLIKPVWQKHIVSDFTPEALVEVHKFNKRGVGVYADELAGFINNFNRYHKGSEQEFWLSIWSGKPVNTDRKGGDPVFIPLPFIPVCGNIQTRILFGLAKENRSQNGFIDRMLFAFPEGIEKPYLNELEIDPDIIFNWKTIISSLLDEPLKFDDSDFCPEPTILKYSPDAYQVLKAWLKQNTDLCNSTSPENEGLASLYGKFDIHIIRLSLIIERLRWACNESPGTHIGVDSVNAAISLAEYFRNTSEKVHSIISNHNPLDKLPEDKKKLYEALPDVFKTEIGLQVATEFKIPERTFKRLLNDKTLFNRIKQGEYEKKF